MSQTTEPGALHDAQEASHQAPVTLGAALAPQGLPYLDEGAATPIARDAADRIKAAFAEGPGPGLLHLGAAELGAALPPSLSFLREVGRLFVTRLCQVPDLEESREKIDVPPPDAELALLADSAPPMRGGEYLTEGTLRLFWDLLNYALRAALREFPGTVQDYLQAQAPAWNLVGRVCFNLAENRRGAAAPFAFLATYTTRLSQGQKAQHRPLGQALGDSARAEDRLTLLSLLTPVQRAAARSELVQDLLSSKALFRPLAWSAAQAHRFLKDIPILEESGVIVRVPESWQGRRPPRPRVTATIGRSAGSSLGLGALLDFSVEATLDGEALTDAEWRALLSAGSGLVSLRGRWVEVDADQLRGVMDRFTAARRLARREGLTFAEALRLLSGTDGPASAAAAGPAAPDWSEVRAGPWLAEVLRGLRDPEAMAQVDPGPALRATLRPYQQVGLRWLWLLHRLGLGGCLADDMGLGKTLQVIALLLRRKQAGEEEPALLVVPASLLANWQGELSRFAPGLRVRICHPSAQRQRGQTDAAEPAGADVIITSYGYLQRAPALREADWGVLVVDEAQAIKNPQTQQTRAVKGLRARTRLALTGTPVENRLSDLWSIFDFACPGLLGDEAAFTGLARRLEQRGDYAPLRELVRPYLLRRLKSDRRVIADLPDKTEVTAYCGLTGRQAALYQQAVEELSLALEDTEGMKRRGVILAALMRFKQICNHPAQSQGLGEFSASESGKFVRLRELCEPMAERQEKVLVFTQFREMTGPLHDLLAGVFGREGLVLHGQTAVKARAALVRAFQADDGPPFFVLSLKAGGSGLNLTAASHVVHFDRWWNPAVEDQATDRAYRIGQHRNVLVHKFVCRGTIEERIDEMIRDKRALQQEIVQGGGEVVLTEMSDEKLLALVTLDIKSATQDS